MAQQDQKSKGQVIDARTFLAQRMPDRETVDQWFAGKLKPDMHGSVASIFDGELGWLKTNCRRKHGMNGSFCTYTYGPYDERKMINGADKPCRINTYGNSFTMCDQVSDGETWQEVLAAHLGEPIRNFGIGGYSVYQAYLRMLREEARAPADFLIFNIFADDHFRNLEPWWSIRWGKLPTHIGKTLPSLQVDLKTGICTERPNEIIAEKDLVNLCDLDWLLEKFKDDFVLSVMLEHANAQSGNPDSAYKDVMQYSPHGMMTSLNRSRTFSLSAQQKHTRAALTASMQVVEWIEKYAQDNGKQVLYVLSFGPLSLARVLRERERFDGPFVDFLKRKKLPTIDLMEIHQAQYRQFNIDVKKYLDRYFIGHYNPRGNFFTAFNLKDKLVEMLDPKPAAYWKS